MVAAISDPMDEEEMPKGALCCWIPDSQIGACGCDKSVSPGLCSRLICAECVYVNYVGLTVCGVLMLILFDMAVLGLFCNRIYVVCCWSPKLWGTHYHRKMIAVGAPMMAHPAAAPVVVQQQQQHLYGNNYGAA
ncbi:unnamed protein product [Amoebophrya sp. A25]|nr:unnamed protein product [Amoebophrya sp. A25]|eukprot:GSA25T00012960001.1